MLIDTHAHLASARFDGESERIVEQAGKTGIDRILSISTDLEDAPKNIALSEKFPNVYASVGIHPTSVHEIEDPEWLSKLKAWASHPKVVAIGECGLDFFHPPRNGSSQKDWAALQERFLRPQIDLALELDLPLVVHTRSSLAETMRILCDHAPGAPLKAVLHCFVDGPEAYATVEAAGFLVSFTGVVTFPKAPDLHKTVAAVPQGSFMLETDSPFLAPIPHRGKRCEPAFLNHTAEAVAKLRGTSLDAIALETTRTAERFFNLPLCRSVPNNS